jgi:phosphoribosylglycinamide formyltransferase 1
LDESKSKAWNIPITIDLMICNVPDAYCITRAQMNLVPNVLIDHTIYERRELFEQDVVRLLIDHGIDIVLLAGWMRIFKFPYIFEEFGNRILNIHPSLLPKYPCTNSIKKAFDNRDLCTGVTVHIATQEVDAGPMIAQLSIPILKIDSLEKIEKKVHLVEHQIYPLAVQLAYELYWK